jgi:CPA2 family monovalent cation:H+ antiporter-2
MEGIAILLCAAAFAYAAARALRLPPVPLLLAGGLVVGNVAVVPPGLLEDALILGVTFLLFVTGIELGPQRTRRQRKAVIRVGFFQFVLLGLAGYGGALLIGIDGLGAIFVALALTASSTLVVVRLLRQRRQMFEPFGRLVTGVLLLQDLFVILLIPIVMRAPAGPLAVLGGVAAVGLLLALAAIAWKWVAPLVVRIGRDDESLLLATLAMLFVFIGITSWLDLPLVVGAFLAGVALSGFPANAVVRPQLASVGDFFSAIFFTALGALIGVPTFPELLQAAVLAGIVVLLTPPLVTAVAEWAGLSARPAIESGLLLAQTSELSLVVVLYGMLEGEITTGVFTVIALVTLATMLLTPFITADRVAWRLLHLHQVRMRGRDVPEFSDHVLLLGSGTTGMPLLETLFVAGHEVVVVDDDPDVVHRLREAEVSVIRGDATDLEVLRRACARDARLITSTVRRPEDNRRLLQYARGVPMIVRVFEEEDAEWIRAAGGTPVLYSEAAADGLLEWFNARERDEETRA